MSKKWGQFIFIVTVFSTIFIFLGVSNKSLNKNQEDTNGVHSTDTIDKNLIPIEELTGKYNVKDDKKSTLYINEDGTYELNINVCEGYLEIKGNYERIDKKLKLINTEKFPNYDSLQNNNELSFTIIDNDTIRLDEDLVCIFQNTLFER